MKNIVFIGQLTDISGYGNAARAYVRSLLSLHSEKLINLKLIDFSYERVKVKLEKEISDLVVPKEDYEKLLDSEYELIFFLVNEAMSAGDSEERHSRQPIIQNSGGKINCSILCDNAKKIYPCVVWETDKVPLAFAESYKRFSHKIETLLCACEWNRQTFFEQTGINSVTVPYPISKTEDIDYDFLNKLEKVKNNRFTFISLSQWSYRKGFDKLIKAFLLEFKNEPVNLILKTYANKSMTDEDETKLISDLIDRERKKLSFNGVPYSGDCSIIVINSLLSDEQINSVYKSADCMVSCTRGEGFGLPIADFISSGGLVVVPNKGGHLDFCSEENFFIDSRYEPFELCPNHLYSSDMNLVEVSLSSTMKNMRHAYELIKNNKEEVEQRVQKSKDFCNNYLSLENNRELFKEALKI